MFAHQIDSQLIISNYNKQLLCFSLIDFSKTKEIIVKEDIFVMIRLDDYTLMMGGRNGNV